MRKESREQVQKILAKLDESHEELQKILQKETQEFLKNGYNSEDCTGKFIDIINDGLAGIEECRLCLDRLIGT